MSFLSRFGLNHFLDIEEDVFKEAVRINYANLTVPEVLEGTEPIFNSHLLGTLIEFSLSTIYELLTLPKER